VSDIVRHEARAHVEWCWIAAISRVRSSRFAKLQIGTLVQHLNIEATQFHRAEEDANYCGQLLLNLSKKCQADWFCHRLKT